MKTLIIVALAFVLNSAWGAGSMALEGKVQNFTPEIVEISDGRNVYRVLRKKIFPGEAQELAKLKTGDKLSLMVPFEAIESVKPVKK